MMGQKRVVAGVIVGLLLFAAVAAARRSVDGEFGYVFHETTGQNQYALVNGRKLPLTFDEAASDPEALAMLRRLDWRVLYANADGRKLFLVGRYYPGTRQFVLRRWFLAAPFCRIRAPDGLFDREEVAVRVSTRLSPDDFPSTPGDPPLDGGVDLSRFVHDEFRDFGGAR